MPITYKFFKDFTSCRKKTNRAVVFFLDVVFSLVASF